MAITANPSVLDVADDPVARKATTVFKVPALYPYQRLVVANILDAHLQFEPSSPPQGLATFMPEAEEVAEEPRPPVEADSRSRQLVILPTGAGKSLCFQLPATILEGITVVVYPLVSLMEDQARRLRELDIPSLVLRGGTSPREQEAAIQQAERGLVRIILTNPETLSRADILRRIGRLPVSHLVIDEAHCVVEWGKTFRPSYLEIHRCAGAIEPRVTTAFTATASPTLLDGIRAALFPDGCHLIRGNPDRSNIAYHVVPVLSRNQALTSLLGQVIAPSADCSALEGGSLNDVFRTARGEDVPHLPYWQFGLPARRPALVFCRSRVGAELTAAYLRRSTGRSEVYFYHAGLSREEKTQVEEWFFGSADGILVATVAYGMGVDKKNIRTVIHLDPPASLESYLQESGRAGRDGNPANAILLTDRRQRLGRQSETELERSLIERGRQVLDYIGSRGCRRSYLLNAMGWERSEVCFGCDVCFGHYAEAPLEETRCMGFIRRNRRRFLAGEIVELLGGTYSQNDWLPTRQPPLHGWRPDECRDALLSLVERRKIWVIRHGPWKGRIDVC